MSNTSYSIENSNSHVELKSESTGMNFNFPDKISIGMNFNFPDKISTDIKFNFPDVDHYKKMKLNETDYNQKNRISTDPQVMFYSCNSNPSLENTTKSDSIESIGSIESIESIESDESDESEKDNPFLLTCDYVSKTPFRKWNKQIKKQFGFGPFSIISETQETINKNRYVHTTDELNRCRYDDYFLKNGNIVTVNENGDCVNFVDASYIGEKFISASAPIPYNYENWWNMIYDKVNIIVMVTPYIESNKLKADRYIPYEDDKFTSYGIFLIKSNTIEINETSGIVITKLTVRKSLTDNINDTNSIDCTDRIVYHIHYTRWTDHHIPDYNEFKILMNVYDKYVQMYDTEYSTKNLKPLVHCSAGVGRTGTFIAIRYLMDDISLKRTNNSLIDVKFNIAETIKWMRDWRSGMVQTVSQFQFIYDYIREAIINNEL